MNVIYDKETNILMITFAEDRIKESNEISPGIIADYGYSGKIVRLEILDASENVEKAQEISLAVAA